MSANFFDLQRYAATGITSPNMTDFDKMRARALFPQSYPSQTITGIPPLSFKANGQPLSAWSIFGNSQQNGTPTPDAPIMPEFVGERTANLVKNDGVSVEYRGVKYTVNPDKSITAFGTATSGVSYFIFAGDGAAENSIDSYNTPIFKAGETLVFSTNSQTPINARFTDGTYSSSSFLMNEPITLTKDIGLLYIQVVGGNSINTTVYPMVNAGSTAKPYEPYGYKIPITCAGQTVPIYLGQVQTVRRVKKLVLTWDETDGFVSNGRGYIRVHDGMQETIAPYSDKLLGVTTPADESPDFSVKQLQTNFQYTISAALLIKSNVIFNKFSDFQDWLHENAPVTIWYVLAKPETGIVNEPLCKIGDYADELHSEDAAVMIPTSKGQNTLTVDTDLQPSSMTITGKIKEV